MKQKLSKKEAQKIMKIKGEVRGTTLKSDATFILEKDGEEALKKVEKQFESLGSPIKYKDIKTMRFYPVGLRILSLIIIKDVLNYDEKTIEAMGANAPKISLFMKILFRYFVSLKRMAKESSAMWRRYYTVGELSSAKLDEEKRILILRLVGFNHHPVFCLYAKGYFTTAVSMAVNAPVTAQETHCFFRGDKYHEFLFKW